MYQVLLFEFWGRIPLKNSQIPWIVFARKYSFARSISRKTVLFFPNDLHTRLSPLYLLLFKSHIQERVSRLTRSKSLLYSSNLLESLPTTSLSPSAKHRMAEKFFNMYSCHVVWRRWVKIRAFMAELWLRSTMLQWAEITDMWEICRNSCKFLRHLKEYEKNNNFREWRCRSTHSSRIDVCLY